MRLASYINAVPELRWDFQNQEIPDEVHVEVDGNWAQCPRTRRPIGGGLVFWGKHLLDSFCQQQHTISLSSAEAELHEIVNGAARGLFIRNVLQAMELKAGVSVGTDLSAAARITQRLGAGRVRRLEVKDLWIQEEVRSHELKVSRVKSEDSRADVLTKFLDPDRYRKLIKPLPLCVPGIRCEMAVKSEKQLRSVASGVLSVTSQRNSRQSD